MSNQITPNPSAPSQVVAEVTFPRWINNLGIIPTSYKDSMSYYECLAWLCKFLEETVIPSVNQNGDAVEELQNLYIELNSYVDHYFDTLDVQEEINNKLDEMARTGELQPLLTRQYNELRTEVNESIDEFEEYTNNIIASNNLVMNNKIDSATSGSPAGVYSSVSDLTTADPDHSRIYIVNADGYWYYYNTSTSSWTAGGVYQASVDTDTTNTLVNNFNKITDSGTIRNSMTINKGINGVTFLLMDVSGNTTITTTEVFEAKDDILLELPSNSGYKYLVAFYSSAEYSTDGHISNTTWQTGNYYIQKGKFFAIQFKKADNSAFSSQDEKFNLGIKDLASYGEVKALQDLIASKPTLYHIIGTGQSLAVGAEGKPALTTQTPLEMIGKAYMFNGGARPIDGMINDTYAEEISMLDKCTSEFYSLCEQDHELTLGSQEDPRHAYQGETISSAMGYNFSKLTNKMCLVSEHGFGGKSYQQLKKGTTAYNNSIRAVKHAKELCDRYGWNYEVVGVAVVHGEADLEGGTSETTYKNNLIEWQSNYDADIKAITGQTRTVKLYVSQTGATSAYDLTSSPIPNAVFLASVQNPNIRFVCPQYAYPFTYASVHMNNYGYRFLGEFFGNQIGRDFNGSFNNTLFPTKSTYNDTTKKITIEFNGNQGLQFDTNNIPAVSDGQYGFELIDNTSNVSITNISIVEGKVEITVDNTPANGTKISYAYKPTADEMGKIGYSEGGIRGNLRNYNSFNSYFTNQILPNWCCVFCISINYNA